MLRVRKEFVWGSLSLWWKNIIIADSYVCILYHQYTHFEHISNFLQFSSNSQHIWIINIMVSNYSFHHTGCYKSLCTFSWLVHILALIYCQLKIKFSQFIKMHQNYKQIWESAQTFVTPCVVIKIYVIFAIVSS